jgi:hypothetical protein
MSYNQVNLTKAELYRPGFTFLVFFFSFPFLSVCGRLDPGPLAWQANVLPLSRIPVAITLISASVGSQQLYLYAAVQMK